MANPTPPTAPPPVQNGRAAFLALVASLAAVLALLFARSFLPDHVHFANDGPLGAAESAAGRMPAAMTGVWMDLNWVGNEGVASAPSLSNLLCVVLSPVAYAKVIVPLSLLLLGCAAWVFFRQCGFAPWVCTVGGIAAALNGDRFSVAAWGLSIWVLGTAAVFLALAALMATNRRRTWAFVMLAGFATGLGVMEGFDTGAIFSLVVAAFALWLAWATGPGTPGERVMQGLGRVAVVALCAGFIATYTLGTLISTQVKGVIGMAQDKETRARRYSEATTWSLPKIEALRVLIPGLFGYRMDTPDGGAYWGSVGQNPGLPQLKEAAAKGDAQAKAALANPTLFRHSGSGEYGGVLVVLLAAFALAQAARSQAGAFTEVERRLVWFWAGIALLSLLFAFGRHAPFYKLFYSLPYASTIRNPVKFMHPFHLALIVLCGYGLHALAKQFIKPAATEPGRLTDQVGSWWNSVTGFERRWTLATFGLAALGMFGLLLYGSARKELEKHLVSVAFSEDMAKAIASHSVGEVGWFVFFLALSAGAVAVALSGYWSGARVRWAGVTLGLLLAVDLARANTPWIIYWNYQEKYASNPIIELLKQTPYERRVQSLPFNISQFAVFQQLYGMEWTQHLFLYNNIQCLDITQEPRSTAENKAYRETFLGRAETLARLWELTNTRFIFGLNGTNFLNSIGTQLDPGQNRFRIHTPFDIVAKPGVGNATRLDQVTVVTNGPGQFALIEFTGALPRAKLYPHWQVMTNDTEILARLANPAFKPQDMVLVSSPLPAATNDPGTNAGEVKFVAYAPKRIQLEASAVAPSVLLLNDKHSPNWKVSVDGQPATLLRCNYLMRGVPVPAGRHTVEFRYEPPVTGLYVTAAAMASALFLLLLVAFTRQAEGAPPLAKPVVPPPAK